MIYICIPYTPDRKERLEVAIDSIRSTVKAFAYTIVTYENDYIGWANAVRNMIDGLDDDSLMFLLESDTLVQEGCVDLLAANYMTKFATASKEIVLEPFNELHNGTLIQHPFCKVKVLKKYINRAYFHQFADNEMSDRIKQDCEYIYLPEAKMEHRHVVNGKAIQDEGYKVVFDQERIKKDQEIYYRFKKERL